MTATEGLSNEEVRFIADTMDVFGGELLTGEASDGDLFGDV